MKKVFLCNLSNISSGNCSQDCRFCTQNVKKKTNIQRYKQKEISVIVEEAKFAARSHANGFCLVTSGLALDKHTKKYVLSAVEAIKKEVDIRLIACNGLACRQDLADLKSAGVEAYNHNLECQRDFYKTICTTHDWQERYQTCINVNEAGLFLISGGIFGIGETKEQRKMFLQDLKSVQPKKIPLNFYIPNKDLDLPYAVMQQEEALEIVRMTRDVFKEEIIMLAGGRELVFGDDWLRAIEAGANSIIIGGYLTTGGNAVNSDVEKLLKAGYSIG